MQWFGQWYGGSGYSLGDDSNLEVFDSLTHARNELDNRYRLGYSFRQTFKYVNLPSVFTEDVDSTYLEALLEVRAYDLVRKHGASYTDVTPEQISHLWEDDVYCPIVEDDSEIRLWRALPMAEDGIVSSIDAYPDKLVKFGPRMGVVIENA